MLNFRRNTFSRFSNCRIFFFPSSISAVNSSRVFSLGFVMVGCSFLPVGIEKGQSIFSAALCGIFSFGDVYKRQMLHRVLKRAGLPKVRFHDLRHTFATLALQNGVDIKTVSGMLGHFSAGFTLDTYAHVTTVAQKEAANTMEKVLANANI